MNLDDLLRTARSHPAPPTPPWLDHGFETRILARIREQEQKARQRPLAWRLAPWFALPVLLLALWTGPNPLADPTEPLLALISTSASPATPWPLLP